MRSTNAFCSVVVALSSLIAQAAEQDSVVTASSPVASANDPMFASAGHFSATAATGVPYLAIGEAAYAFTDRFSMGVIGGITPTTEGAGIRLRGVIAGRGADHLLVVSPLLYYPATAGLGNEPWVLAMPSVLAEHRFDSGIRAHAGFGVAAATCTDALASFFEQGPARMRDNPGGFMGDLWATATVGASWPLAARTSVFSDVSLVSQGLTFDRPWIGGPPVVATLGIEHAF
jgi:hypothetical protein